MAAWKDYSRPLHVDCSVEYELPNAAKLPTDARTEPLLMIHPCYYRRAESQKRSPFVNNMPVTRQTHYPVRYAKRDPLLCDSGDSGVGLGHWTDSGSPEHRLNVGPDSGIVEDKTGLTTLTDLLGLNYEVINNNRSDGKVHQPAVGVAAVTACKACQPPVLHSHQQRTQQPWPGVTAAAARHRVRAVEPGPEHAAWLLNRRPQLLRPAPPARPTKRSRLPPPTGNCCKMCTQCNYPQCRTTDDNSRILWNNDSMQRLYQV